MDTPYEIVFVRREAEDVDEARVAAGQSPEPRLMHVSEDPCYGASQEECAHGRFGWRRSVLRAPTRR